jgi:hypothetical protein
MDNIEFGDKFGGGGEKGIGDSVRKRLLTVQKTQNIYDK